jgi:hypothetical protein
MLKSSITSGIVMACAAFLAFGQAAGPGGAKESSITMRGKAISVKYSASSMAGRKIFGATVPYSQVWRIGDAPVSFHTDADLEVQGLAVPKGSYSLFILPQAQEWQLIISKQTGPQAKTYTTKFDLGRVPMDMKKSPAPVDPLRITLTSFGSVAGKLEVAWENTIASVPFNLDVVKANPEW